MKMSWALERMVKSVYWANVGGNRRRRRLQIRWRDEVKELRMRSTLCEREGMLLAWLRGLGKEGVWV